MIKNMFDDLKVNHIGIIINRDLMHSIEKETGNLFIEDEIQGVWVCFVWDEALKLYKEYITKEGRVKNSQIGFNHVCYDINSQNEMNNLHNIFLKNRIGIRLTLPEPSPTDQCNIVTFYKIIGVGIVEFNILDWHD
tara:strand:- start:39 stop:446 length:408 start_codon:yes stop_codon:yes gene_type:complete